MEKEKIREYALKLGADAVGFASIDDYEHKGAVDPQDILPGVKSLVVSGYREINGAVESANHRTMMASRMASMDFSLKNNYLLSRYIEDEFGVKAASVPVSYPLGMDLPSMGTVGDISLRHAAVAAGLGVFGRHNLVIHPRFGTRIVFTAVLTQLPLASDPRIEEELCTQCGLCVELCPAGALDEEGKTHTFRCLKVSQPYGIGHAIRYIERLFVASEEERKELLRDPMFLSLYQASFIGFQYACIKCMSVCPVGIKQDNEETRVTD